MLLGNNIVIFRTILVGHMIMIVSWAIENNLVYLRPILVYDCNNFLVISTGWLMILIVSWVVENNLVFGGGG